MRLYKGDYNQETVFSDDPLNVALKWQSFGVTRLHLVDLDGAASGEPANLAIIRKIAANIMIPVQVGGGIRSMQAVKKLVTSGVDKVILGTSAVEKPELVSEICASFADSLIVSIDANDGMAATRGWVQQTEIKAEELIKRMMDIGVRQFVYTDISRDGTLSEPNFSALFELMDKFNASFIASGGICKINHLKMLAKLGAKGAIIGRALYTGDIDLKRALDVIERENNGGF